MHVICICHSDCTIISSNFHQNYNLSFKNHCCPEGCLSSFFPAPSTLFLSDESTVLLVKYKKARKTETWRKGLCLQEQGQELFSTGVTCRAMSEGIARLRTHLGLSQAHGWHPSFDRSRVLDFHVALLHLYSYHKR